MTWWEERPSEDPVSTGMWLQWHRESNGDDKRGQVVTGTKSVHFLPLWKQGWAHWLHVCLGLSVSEMDNKFCDSQETGSQAATTGSVVVWSPDDGAAEVGCGVFSVPPASRGTQWRRQRRWVRWKHFWHHKHLRCDISGLTCELMVDRHVPK